MRRLIASVSLLSAVGSGDFVAASGACLEIRPPLRGADDLQSRWLQERALGKDPAELVFSLPGNLENGSILSCVDKEAAERLSEPLFGMRTDSGGYVTLNPSKLHVQLVQTPTAECALYQTRELTASVPRKEVESSGRGFPLSDSLRLSFKLKKKSLGSFLRRNKKSKKESSLRLTTFSKDRNLSCSNTEIEEVIDFGSVPDEILNEHHNDAIIGYLNLLTTLTRTTKQVTGLIGRRLYHQGIIQARQFRTDNLLSFLGGYPSTEKKYFAVKIIVQPPRGKKWKQILDPLNKNDKKMYKDVHFAYFNLISTTVDPVDTQYSFIDQEHIVAEQIADNRNKPVEAYLYLETSKLKDSSLYFYSTLVSNAIGVQDVMTYQIKVLVFATDDIPINQNKTVDNRVKEISPSDLLTFADDGTN